MSNVALQYQIDLDPVDRTAAMVVSKAPRLARYPFAEPAQDPSHEKIIADALVVPGGKKPPGFIPDRRGERVGRLTVVAFGQYCPGGNKPSSGQLAAGKTGSAGRTSKWVVKCQCGRLEVWNHKSLFRKSLADSRVCAWCNRAQYLEQVAAESNGGGR